MKALSIRQPWAWLIAKGIKDVENRSWPTDFRGRIYIHAGAKFDTQAMLDNRLCPWLAEALIDDETGKQLDELHRNFNRHGAIIGEVDLFDCKYQYDLMDNDFCSPWAESGKYGFYLANAVLYDEPIPCRGQLGFFGVEFPNGTLITAYSPTFRNG